MANAGTEIELGEVAIIGIAVIVIVWAVKRAGGSLLGSLWCSANHSIIPFGTTPSVQQCVQKAVCNPTASWWAQHPNLTVPGTGQTVAELHSDGYSDAEIQQLFINATKHCCCQCCCPQPFGQCSD